MARKQFNARLPAMTTRQIKELVSLLGVGSEAEVVMVAVDRLYQHMQYEPPRLADWPERAAEIAEAGE